MSNAHVRAQFDEGIERAVGHWLCHWREHGHSPEGEAAAAGHALAALRWCIASGRALDPAIDLALALQTYMMHQGQWSEWEALLHRLLEQAGCASQERRFALRHYLGAVYMRQHRLAESLALTEENYRWALAATEGYPVYQAKARLFLGQAAFRSGCWQEALAHFELALGLVTSYGDEVGRATVQISMGRALAALGRLDDATHLLEDSVRVHRRHGNQPAERVAVQRL